MSNLLAQSTNTAAPAQIDLFKPAVKQGLPFSGATQAAGNAQFGLFLGRVLQGMMAIGFLAVLVFLIWGAIEWITAGGEKGKIEAARNKITGAVMGIIVLASTIAIFSLVQNFLGVHILSFPGGGATETTTTSDSGVKCDWATPGEMGCNFEDCHQYYCQASGKWQDRGKGGICKEHKECDGR